MKRNYLISRLKKPILYSAFPVVLLAAYGSLKTAEPAVQPEINPNSILVDTLPGDTIDDPKPADTMGYPGDPAPDDTSTYPTEDYFPTDTADDIQPVDTAGAGEGFGDPFPADTNGFDR